MPAHTDPIPTYQKQLFTFVCSEEGHDFGVVGEGYYKRNENNEAIEGKVYRVILCPRCGESREILIVDRTASNGKVPSKTKITRRRAKK